MVNSAAISDCTFASTVCQAVCARCSSTEAGITVLRPHVYRDLPAYFMQILLNSDTGGKKILFKSISLFIV